MNILKSGALADFCVLCNGNEPFMFLSNYEGVDLASSAADVLDIFSEVCCETASALSFARVPATLFPPSPPSNLMYCLYGISLLYTLLQRAVSTTETVLYIDKGVGNPSALTAEK